MYPQKTIFLIDTYDTLRSGIENAITVGRTLAEKGYNFGVRLDSGDMQYLSCEVRKRLDKAGFPDAFISVSNELTEEIIETLVLQNAPITSWGVGTHMVTGGNESSFTGVYKLAARHNPEGDENGMIPTMKFSDNPEKTTNPGIKNVWRLYDENGMARADIMTLDGETIPTDCETKFYHPAIDYRHFTIKPASVENMHRKYIEGGKRTYTKLDPAAELRQSRKNMQRQLASLDDSYKRILDPHIYKVSLSSSLKKLKLDFIENRSN
jgi:nicotinate phosphoribosyltransferase